MKVISWELFNLVNFYKWIVFIIQFHNSAKLGDQNIDPGRVEVTCKIPHPTDRKSLLCFSGFIKFLNPFIANAACKTENLRYLTRFGIDYLWFKERINYNPCTGIL